MACKCSPTDFLKNVPLFILAHCMGFFWAVVVFGKLLLQKLTGTLPATVPSRTRAAPKILTDLKFGEHRYLTLKNGIKIHYVASGPVDKPLILFIHGFPDFWFGWRHQIPYFNKNYRVVALDLRGYGDSDKPSGVRAYALPNLIEDIKQFIEGMDRKSCILVGHDWGGLVAWSVATAHPELVDRLVCLNSPHPAAFRQQGRQNLGQVLKSWYVFLFQFPWLAEIMLSRNDMEFLEDTFTKPPLGAKPGTFSKTEIEAFKYTFGKPGAFTPPVNYYRNMFPLFPPPKPVWRHLPMPVLVIFGTGDGAISTPPAIASGRWVAGYFEIKLLDGVSHWVQHEEPDQVNKAMEQFLEKDIPARHDDHRKH